MSEEIPDFEVTVRLRNNQLVSRRLAMGLTQAQVAASIGVARAIYGHYETMRAKPFGQRGVLKPVARLICDFYAEPASVLFPEAIQAVRVPSVTRYLSGDDCMALMSGYTERAALCAPDEVIGHRDELEKALGVLSPEEHELLKRRYVDGDTLAEVGADRVRHDGGRGVSTERMRQIELRAIRKLQRKLLKLRAEG
jgi:transcriptional regulator with XRE-family HTH domain